MKEKKKIKEISTTSNSNPEFWWILLFFILAISATSIAIYIGDLKGNQEFYFRIIIAISIAGIAAIIPGFLNINIKWLKTSIRSGGAISIFVLIYFFNPATINEEFKPRINLTGKWNFYLQTLEGEIPGGIAEIDHKNGRNVFKINGNVKINPNAPKGTFNIPIITFESQFAIITNSKIIFHYRTNQEEEGVAVAEYSPSETDIFLFNFNDYSNMDKDKYPSGILKFVRVILK